MAHCTVEIKMEHDEYLKTLLFTIILFTADP